MLNVVTAPGVLPHMVNPARADPSLFRARPYGSYGGNGLYVQVADDLITFFTVGAIRSVSLDETGRPLGNTGKYIRGIKLSGISVECERMVAFFGHVFGLERCM